jgi:hypothetical protein
MTTYYEFVPSRVSAPVFTPTLDGNQYNVTVVWNVSSKRYYIYVITMDGILIAAVPLIESPTSMPISNAYWDPQNARAVVTTTDPHPFIIGAPVKISINSMGPNGYNGSGFALPLSKTEICYPVAINPGEVTVMGVVDYLINLVAPYFKSTLVYRNQTFEVSP